MAKGSAKKAAAIESASPSSNWKALKRALQPSTGPEASPRRKRSRSESSPTTVLAEPRHVVGSSGSKGKGKGKEREDSAASESVAGAAKKKEIPIETIMQGGTSAWQAEPGQYLAIDCEMVGVGPEGSESTLARVSIVNYHGVIMLDRFVRPREKVTDYRTWVSGVREEDLTNAPTFSEVQKEVAALIKGRILIGHAISNDTEVLLLSHPRPMTRDTASHPPLQALARTKRPGLKTLAKIVLGLDIQSGEHSSIDDARATMAIYRSQKSSWEDSLRTHTKPVLVTSTTPFLASLDPSTITAGVGKSAKRKTLGLAATLRHARNEALAEIAPVELDEEQVKERVRKKARMEVVDDLIVGFDYAPPAVPAARVEPTASEKAKISTGPTAAKVKKVAGRAFKGDREKRPKSKDGWWVEETTV